MEEEKERRRMRDRQRRRSMTVEQRERHLARRRRNYQLRRLRAEIPSLGSSNPDALLRDPGFESIGNNEDSDLDLIGREKLNSVFLESACQETLGQKSVLRLSRIRCLARSLSYSEFMSKSSAETSDQFGDSDSCSLLGGVRLNRVKRLARGLRAADNEAIGEIHQEKVMTRDETSVVSSPMFGQPQIVGDEDTSTL